MIYNPAVLVLDEATANIDTETEQLIQNALQVVKQTVRLSLLPTDYPRLRIQI